MPIFRFDKITPAKDLIKKV